MSLIRLQIQGISYSHSQNGAYALILQEENSNRKLPIVIGAFEAQSIAMALEEELMPPRPLTHDLFKNFSDAFGIRVKEIIIHKFVDGIFFSIMVCEKNDKEVMLDARTSDAIAMAVRYNAPIYTYQNIMDKAGIILNDEQEQEEEEVELTMERDTLVQDFISMATDFLSGNSYTHLSDQEIQKMLNEAIAEENYEKAAQLRDELTNRGK